MFRTDLIHQAKEAPDGAGAATLYRRAIVPTGIVSGAARRPLIMVT